MSSFYSSEMQDELPSISMEPFGVVIVSIGPVEPKFLNLDQAVDMARRLAQTGVTIQAITQGHETVLEGPKLEAALGETRSEAVSKLVLRRAAHRAAPWPLSDRACRSLR